MTTFDPHDPTTVCLGIDIGGTKIAAGLVRTSALLAATPSNGTAAGDTLSDGARSGGAFSRGNRSAGTFSSGAASRDTHRGSAATPENAPRIVGEVVRKPTPSAHHHGGFVGAAPSVRTKVSSSSAAQRLSSEDYLSVLRSVIDDAVRQAHAVGLTVGCIGIGAPGVVNPDTGVVVSAGPTMPGWAGTRIADAVHADTGLPVAVHNDVRILGLSESTFGAGVGYRRVLFVSLGTGVGGAIVEDGRLVHTPHNTAGELRGLWGPHPDGYPAVIEDFASGPAIAAIYRRRRMGAQAPAIGHGVGVAHHDTTLGHVGRGAAGQGVVETHHPGKGGEHVDLHVIMGRYAAGEILAHTVVDECLYNAGLTLGGFASAVDADAIVLGGGVGNIGEAISTPLRRGLIAGSIGPAAGIPLLPAVMGVNSPIIGAAHLGLQHALAG